MYCGDLRAFWNRMSVSQSVTWDLPNKSARQSALRQKLVAGA